MAGPLSRWPDERIDDLKARVDAHDAPVASVAVLTSRMDTLAQQLAANTKGQKRISEQFEQAQLEPLTRSRALRNALIVGFTSATLGGGFALLGGTIASHH